MSIFAANYMFGVYSFICSSYTKSNLAGIDVIHPPIRFSSPESKHIPTSGTIIAGLASSSTYFIKGVQDKKSHDHNTKEFAVLKYYA